MSAGFMLPFIIGSILTAVTMVMFYLTLKSTRRRHKLLSAATHASGLSRDAILHLFSQDHGGLPPWLRSPDSNESAWLNKVTEVLWPYIDKAGTEWAFSNHNLETLLNSQTFWKPSWLASSGVVLQSLVMGQTPPRVTGVKVYPSMGGGSEATGPGGAPGALVMDLSFDWASKMQAQIAMKIMEGQTGMSIVDRMLGVLYRTVSVKVVIQDLVARGQLRVVATPLLGTLPVVGAVRVSFLEVPAISYKVSSFGANPLMIPGLETWLSSFISEQVLAPFTFPDGLLINVGELFGIAVSPPPVRPEGLLAVTIKRALNVPRTDLFGLSDPYVKVYLTKKVKHRTSVKGTTLSPVWDENFEFVVQSASHQRLHLELWDSDALRADDEIGRVEVALSSLDLTPGHTNHLSVVIPPMGKKAKRKTVPKYEDDSDENLPERTGDPANAHGVRVVAPEGPVARSGRIAGQSRAGQSLDAHPAGGGTQTREAAHQQRVEGVQTGGIGSAHVTGSDRFRVNMERMAAMGRRRECTLELEVQYLPFTSQEVQAAADAASGIQRSISSLSFLSPRLRKLLQGGMLFVNLTRAEGLSGSTGVTRKFKLKVKIGPREGATIMKKTAERTGVGRGLDSSNPMFDQSLDFLIDGDLAHRGDTMVRVEIWVTHFLLRPTFKGSVAVPLARVLANGRLHDSWPLEGAGAGRLEMNLEWLGTMQTLA